MNHEYAITKADFDMLLAWLDPDRDQAGLVYEQIRRRLIKIFECRGRHDSDELADETINRVILKVPKIAEDYVGEKALYFYAVAQKVFLESLRKRQPVDLPPTVVVSEDLEQEYECLDRCVLQLSNNNRELVIAYYQDDKRAKIEHRKALAEKLGVAQNALRIRAHRIRQTLQKCVESCLQQKQLV